MDAAVAELADWLEQELPDCRRDEAFARRFLLGCKMRQNVARDKIRNFHKLKEKTPQWFSGRDPLESKMAKLLELGIFLPLLEKDAEGRTIIIVRATINNPRTHPMMDVFKVGMMVLDVALEEDEAIVEHGVVVLIDLRDVSMHHAFQMTPQLIRRTVYLWQDCYPVRIKGMHFVNCPLHVNAVLSIFKKFMREKLKRRVFTHGQHLSALHEKVPAIYLPMEYQGTNGTIQDIVQHWKTFTINKRDWLMAQG